MSNEQLIALDPTTTPATLRKFKSLVDKGLVSAEALQDVLSLRDLAAGRIADSLLGMGVPKHELLRCASEHYGVPFVEYEEGLVATEAALRGMDLEVLKQELWFPLSIHGGVAEVVAWDPHDPALSAKIKKTFGVASIEFRVALPGDIVLFIENHQDVNPRYTPAAGRTRLAKLRNWLAEQRVMLGVYRTVLAKGRTGLAFIRTGISFISIGLVLLRIFGFGILSILEGILIVVGAIMVADGLKWYLPVHKFRRKPNLQAETEPTFGTTVLELVMKGDAPFLLRGAVIQGANHLRSHWGRLTPVMRRRFLAIDRTDLAEERTILAGYRTVMARARTGLAFTRTGIAFLGLGVALFKQFHSGPWSVFDGSLIVAGGAMMLEGFYWYFPGHRAGRKSAAAVREALGRTSIWDFMFPPMHRRPPAEDRPLPLCISDCHAAGILGTTGLALERTLVAERRNVKSRLRTIMAQSRTGLAFIRTGTSLISVGMGLLLFFGFENLAWSIPNLVLIGLGLALWTDGTYWHFPAERARKQLPYCYSHMEIAFPDYGKPCEMWQKVVFDHEEP